MTPEVHELSVRRPGTREPSQEVHGEGVRRLVASKRSVILIHGYANSADRALTSYSRFVANVEETFWPNMPVGLVDFFGFQWPGDHPSRVRNVISFSTRIGSAYTSGVILGRLLAEKLTPDHQVVLVAHSLGNRAALACLEYLAHTPTGPSVRSAFLLAAAVPVRDAGIEGGAPGYSPIFSARHAAKYSVFYSKWDRVLFAAFRPGNWLHDNGGIAIGRTGGPAGPRWDRRVNTKFDHSDYWPSRRVARSVMAEIYPASARLLYESAITNNWKDADIAWDLPEAQQRF